MIDNRTTELLRKLLDERGEHYVHDGNCVTWIYYSDPHTATESMDGTLIVTGLTPEQAIAAWNTRAEMSYEDARILLDELGLSERMCHPVIAITDDGGYEYALCSECDGRIEPEDNYCPNCGARVVE